MYTVVNGINVVKATTIGDRNTPLLSAQGSIFLSHPIPWNEAAQLCSRASHNHLELSPFPAPLTLWY